MRGGPIPLRAEVISTMWVMPLCWVSSLLCREEGAYLEERLRAGPVASGVVNAGFPHPFWHPGPRTLPVPVTFSEAHARPWNHTSSSVKGQVYEPTRRDATPARCAEACVTNAVPGLGYLSDGQIWDVHQDKEA